MAADLIVDAEHFQRVVLGGIARAEVSVDISTADFKAMLTPRRPDERLAPSIVRVLADLAEKGVEVRLLHAGVPSAAALRELRPIAHRNLTIRRCPRLHAKAVVIDFRRAYIGSANLTGAGLGAKHADRRNIEWGLWTDELRLIEGVERQFNRLWEGERCTTCRLREQCPVPLEEPDLG